MLEIVKLTTVFKLEGKVLKLWEWFSVQLLQDVTPFSATFCEECDGFLFVHDVIVWTEDVEDLMSCP